MSLTTLLILAMLALVSIAWIIHVIKKENQLKEKNKKAPNYKIRTSTRADGVKLYMPHAKRNYGLYCDYIPLLRKPVATRGEAKRMIARDKAHKIINTEWENTDA